MRKLSTALLAALALSLPAASFAGSTSQYFHPKSPLRYHVMRLPFSTTANIVASVVGVVPPGGATLKAVVVSQVAAGDGTSWIAVPKIGTDELTTADGGFTAAAGANKSTTNLTNPMGSLTAPTGATRPTITAANAIQSGGQSVTVDVTLTGVYNTAVTGVVTLYWEPKY
jgi:hypothetical protein